MASASEMCRFVQRQVQSSRPGENDFYSSRKEEGYIAWNRLLHTLFS